MAKANDRIKCYRCGEYKVARFGFHKNAGSNRGYHSYCKVCRKAERKASNQADPTADITKEQMSEALAVADQLGQPYDEELALKQEAAIMKGLIQTKPFPGTTVEISDRIRKIIGLTLAGNDQAKIAKMLGISVPIVSLARVRYPEAFQLALQEIMERGIAITRAYMWMTRSQLSEIGPIAVKTLSDVMKNPKARENVRVTAALGVMKFINPGGSENDALDEATYKSWLAKLKEPLQEIENENIRKIDDYIETESETIEEA